MPPDTDSSLVGEFLRNLATPAIEAFLKRVMRDPDMATQLAAFETTPDAVAAFARKHGFAFSAGELDAYVEDRLQARLSAEEYAARKRFLAARAAGDIAEPRDRDDATAPRLKEAEAGAPLDRRFVFDGGVIALRGVAEIGALVRLLDDILRGSLGIEDPAAAHLELPGDAFDTRVGQAYDALLADWRIVPAMTDLIAALGMDPADVLWEWPGCRVLRPLSMGGIGRYRTAFTGALAPHRDTWYGSPFHQINFWGPVRSIPPDATLRILPHYFRRTFLNSSRGYDVWQNRAALAVPPGSHADADMSQAIAPELPVGDVIVFSGQQLHASAPNTTERTRVSFEFRLLHRADEEQPWVPENIDYFGRGEIYEGWYDATGDEVWRL